MQPSNEPKSEPPVSLLQMTTDSEPFWRQWSQWVQDHWFQIIIAGVIASAIVLILGAVRSGALRLAKSEKRTGTWLQVVARTLSRTNGFFIVMTGIWVAGRYAHPPEMVEALIRFLFTLAAVLQGAIWARELILGAIEHKTSSEHFKGEAILNAMGLIRLLVSIVVFAVALVVLLDNIGVNVTGLVAGLGVGGIAIGLAAQGIFADLFAALAIIFDRPFSKGDGVNVEGNFGVIEAIGLKSTRIRAYTGEEIVIANKNLLEKTIFRLADRTKIRTKYMVGVAYETPVEVLERLPAMLKELVESVGGEASRAGFEGFGASSLDHAVWIDTAGPDWAVAHETRDRFVVALMRKFEEEGITIAYPTQTTFTAAPDGRLVMPYADVQPVRPVEDAGGSLTAKG
jgi:small-conductance mechanosensitive channel